MQPGIRYLGSSHGISYRDSCIFAILNPTLNGLEIEKREAEVCYNLLTKLCSRWIELIRCTYLLALGSSSTWAITRVLKLFFMNFGLACHRVPRSILSHIGTHLERAD